MKQQYFVIGERKDRDTVRRVFWSQRDQNPKAIPEFSCQENDAISLTKEKAKACMKYLNHTCITENGIVEYEPYISGSNPVFNICAIKTESPILLRV